MPLSNNMKRIIILLCVILSVDKLISKEQNTSFQLYPCHQSIEIFLSKSTGYQKLSYTQIQNEIPIVRDLFDKLPHSHKTESLTDK